MNISTAQLSVIVIVMVVLIIFAIHEYQLYKAKQLDVSILLLDSVAIIVDLSTNALKVFSLDVYDFKDEDEFREALATEVTDQLLVELKDTSIIKYLKLVSKDKIIAFVETVFRLYESDIGVKDLFDSYIADRLAASRGENNVNTLSPIETPNDNTIETIVATTDAKSDITSEINTFYDK